MFFLAANYGGIFISSKEQLFGTASEPQIGLSFLESQRPQATSFTAKAHVRQEREGNVATPWELGWLSLEQTIDFPSKITNKLGNGNGYGSNLDPKMELQLIGGIRLNFRLIYWYTWFLLWIHHYNYSYYSGVPPLLAKKWLRRAFLNRDLWTEKHVIFVWNLQGGLGCPTLCCGRR